MDALSSGARLGPFVLERRLAVGGMAEVWGATRDGAPRALKRMLPSLARDPAMRTMFEDEARIAERIRHPNVVRTFGLHWLEGSWILEMERVDGADLRRVAQRARERGLVPPIPLALRVVADVARALGHAHALRGDDGTSLELVHRDVSPHNVMVQRDGSVKLLDFGVARARDRATRTQLGVIKGKLAYMAPEQLLALEVDARADVFALGVVGWELFAGARPFEGDGDGLIQAICLGPRPSVRTRNAEVSEPLAALLERCLAVRPEDRPASMRVLEAELRRHTHDWPPEASARDTLAAWVAPLLEVPRRHTEPIASAAPPARLAAPELGRPVSAPSPSRSSEPTAHAFGAAPPPDIDELPVPPSVLAAEALRPSSSASVADGLGQDAPTHLEQGALAGRAVIRGESAGAVDAHGATRLSGGPIAALGASRGAEAAPLAAPAPGLPDTRRVSVPYERGAVTAAPRPLASIPVAPGVDRAAAPRHVPAWKPWLLRTLALLAAAAAGAALALWGRGAS